MTELLKRKDYLSDAEPRWCVGCGDYGVLTGFSRALAEIQLPKEKIVMVSGIGCSSRFTYYNSSYGFHTIHGRAPTVATGIKISQPEMSVWIATGDGDALSIGGNHFLHLMRRNPDINFMLFNNQIYGLTKGQVSPTSPTGKVTKSSPFGSVDAPIHPLSLAIAAGATFAARVADTNNAMMTKIFVEAYKHKGISFIEILQNCNIFNDYAWEAVTKKSNRAEATIELEHGKPLIYGANQDKGLRLNGFDLETVDLNDPDVDRSTLLVHDAHNPDPTLAIKLSLLNFPESPYPMGVFRQVEAPVFEEELQAQDKAALKKLGKGNLEKLLNSGETWVVSENGE